MIDGAKRTVLKVMRHFGYDLLRVPRVPTEPGFDAKDFYRPLFSPWYGYGEFAKFYELARPYTLISADRVYVLYVMATNCLALDGEFWECGVYKGGSARMLAAITQEEVTLRLFDTFCGLPGADSTRDFMKRGELGDTTLQLVRSIVGDGVIRPGLIPETFCGLESSRIALAHVDVDLYQSVLDCCKFIYPRLVLGGIVVFDDYGFSSTPGARSAVDEFFSEKAEMPLALSTGQALVIKSSQLTTPISLRPNVPSLPNQG
jgi:O-methyltransferase